jgi:hypothetical protein
MLFVAGCKSSVIQPPSGGMPPPPSSGSPAPSGGSSGGGSQGGGEQSGGQQGGGSSGGGSSGGESSGGEPSGGGSQGDGSSGGASPSTGASGSSGQSGGVGTVPQMEIPMPGGTPGMGGADGALDDPEEGGDGDGSSKSDCGETGPLPGGVGGMGQAGECLGGGGSASDSAESSSGGAAGGSEGGEDAAEGAESSAGGGAEGGTGTGGAGSSGQFPAETDAERAERLGRELDESIGGFDEVLSEEQREVAAVGRNMEGFGGEAGSSGGAGGISLGEQADGGTGAGTVTVANQPQAQRESPVAGLSQEEIRERTPDDIPVMVDDDIIARQLREAALAEEDPQLRERLWEEYRKYNGI